MDPFLFEKKPNESSLEREKRRVAFELRSMNYTELRVCLFKMDVMNDYAAWFDKDLGVPADDGMDLLRTCYYSVQLELIFFLLYPLACGKKIFDQVVPVKDFVPYKLCTVSVDLSSVFNSEDPPYIGQIAVAAMATQKACYPNHPNGREVVREWLQVCLFQSLT